MHVKMNFIIHLKLNLIKNLNKIDSTFENQFGQAL